MMLNNVDSATEAFGANIEDGSATHGNTCRPEAGTISPCVTEKTKRNSGAIQVELVVKVSGVPMIEQMSENKRERELRRVIAARSRHEKAAARHRIWQPIFAGV